MDQVRACNLSIHVSSGIAVFFVCCWEWQQKKSVIERWAGCICYYCTYFLLSFHIIIMRREMPGADYTQERGVAASQ